MQMTKLRESREQWRGSRLRNWKSSGKRKQSKKVMVENERKLSENQTESREREWSETIERESRLTK